MGIAEFTWIPIYQELANRVLGWRKKQPQLISILQAAKDKGYPVISLQDKDKKGKAIPLQVIDPFTFFAAFNRGVTDESRIGILTLLKAKFNLTSPVPSDFAGVPLMNTQKSWFFSYQSEREPDAIDSLWNFAEAIGQGTPESVPPDLFERCLSIQNVGLASLTMGMFWMRPDLYLALDSRNRQYLQDNGIKVDVQDWPSYLALRTQIAGEVDGVTWPRLSSDAYDAATNGSPGKGTGLEVPLNGQVTHYWVYAPGPSAKYWEECQAKGIMLIGFDELPNLSQYKTQADISQALKKSLNLSGEPTNDALGAWEFANVLKPGDIVIAKRGTKTYLGYGVVEGPYEYDKTRETYRNFRRVKWVNVGEWPAGDHNIAIKTLTDVTPYEGYVEKLRKMLDIEPEEKIGPPVSPILLAKNIILYGPPGTGKTFRLRNEYMERFTNRKIARTAEEKNAELIKGLTWWEVVALALLDISGNRGSVAEILLHPLVQARSSLSVSQNPRAILWLILQTHTKADCLNVKYTSRSEPLLFEKDDKSIWSVDKNLVDTANPDLVGKLKAYQNPDAGGNTEVRHYAFTTFHQSFSYEDFIEGIKPQMEDTGDGQLTYEIRNGIFKEMAQKAEKDPSNDYAIFIDEINRGNVASIFGELITLIEEDKRLGAVNELKAGLPYSREEFGVPQNLHIIGTMNTADRSVEALDTALRRRFTFIEMRPNPALISSPEGLDVDLRQIFEVINARIEQLLDHDHCIGHAYFMDVENIHDLRKVFANKIIPLLREYFYGNPAKVGMVLGEQFIKRKAQKASFAPGNWGLEELDEKEVYIFADVNTLGEEAFRSIYASTATGI